MGEPGKSVRLADVAPAPGPSPQPRPAGRPATGGAGAPAPVRTFCVLALVYVAMVVAVVWWMSDRNGGHFVYALDDPYIHLAVADNLAFHGTWVSTPACTSRRPSSPAWTVLTAAGLVAFPFPDLWV